MITRDLDRSHPYATTKPARLVTKGKARRGGCRDRSEFKNRTEQIPVQKSTSVALSRKIPVIAFRAAGRAFTREQAFRLQVRRCEQQVLQAHRGLHG